MVVFVYDLPQYLWFKFMIYRFFSNILVFFPLFLVGGLLFLLLLLSFLVLLSRFSLFIFISGSFLLLL